MKSLNQQVDQYTALLRQGDLQVAYRGILEFMGKLRSDFAGSGTMFEVGGSLYQGYMDMTYFSLSNRLLKERALKIAIVYLHPKKAFEAWLSARNRTVLGQYRALFADEILDELEVFHDETNEDAVLECLLTDSPDFDRQDALSALLGRKTEAFISAIEKLILNLPTP